MDLSDSDNAAAELACAQFVKSNPATTLTDSAKIISTLLNNLAREDSAKFRRVNLQNARVKAAVVTATNATDILLAAGFEPTEDGAALENKASDAQAKCAATALALDEACSRAENASFLLRLSMPHEGAGVRSCAYAGDGATLLTGAMDNIVRVFPSEPPLSGDAVPCAALVGSEPARVNGVMALRALPGGEVASGGRDGKVCGTPATAPAEAHRSPRLAIRSPATATSGART